MPEFEFNSTHSEQEWTIVWGNCIISSTRKMFCSSHQEKNSQISTYLCHHWQADKETDYTHYTSKYDSPMTFPQKHRKHVHYCSYQSFLCNKLKDNIKLGLTDQSLFNCHCDCLTVYQFRLRSNKISLIMQKHILDTNIVKMTMLFGRLIT